MKLRILFTFVLFLVGNNIVSGQTTGFTYQGRLTDGALPANASYDFEFRLFDADVGGTSLAIGQRLAVPVSNGVFTVTLDFGAAHFQSGPRFLEILVRPAGGSTFSLLTPRQPVTSVPQAIKALSADTAQSAFSADTASNATNAAQLGSIPANQYVVTGDPRLSDARNPLSGSGNYIQNSASQQPASFNVSGDGTLGGTMSANAVTSATQFNIGIDQALSIRGLTNVFAGRLAGVSNTIGNSNSFFGASAGRFVTTGSGNSFFGRNAGNVNTAGNNSFFGAFSGDSNTTGTNNSFFGFNTGAANTVGNGNSFFGDEAGKANTAGGNSFFGAGAGKSNTTGLFNSFFGSNAGGLNTAGQYNSFFGYAAGLSNTGEYNTFFGSLAGTSNTSANGNTFFGGESGVGTTTGGRNSFFGRWSGHSNTTGADNTFVGFNSALLNNSGTGNTFVGLFAGSLNTDGDDNTVIGANANVASGSSLSHATAIGADAVVSSSNTIQLGRTNGFDTVRVSGLLVVAGLGVAGATDICRNASNQLSTCSSSLRYKSDVRPFIGGLDVVRRLRPITFNWNESGMKDVGFGAEDVFRIEPLLTTRNDNGDIEGVKYAQITTVLINAVNEQQAQMNDQNAQIKAQQNEMREQQRVIEKLKTLVCQQSPEAGFCK